MDQDISCDPIIKLNPHQSGDALTKGRDSFILPREGNGISSFQEWCLEESELAANQWGLHFISCGVPVITTYLLLWMLVFSWGSGGNRHPELHFILLLWWWCEDCYLLPINAVAQWFLPLFLSDWPKLMIFVWRLPAMHLVKGFINMFGSELTPVLLQH